MLGILSITLASVSVGLGRHSSQISPEEFSLLFKYTYASYYLYYVGITLPKYSAILFYTRIFKCTWRTSAVFRTNIIVAAGLVTSWLLFVVVSTIFQCNPVRKGWLPQIPGHCVVTGQWCLGITVASVVIDFYVMLLPIPVLWGLRTGHARKMMMTGLFFCAYW